MRVHAASKYRVVGVPIGECMLPMGEGSGLGNDVDVAVLRPGLQLFSNMFGIVGSHFWTLGDFWQAPLGLNILPGGIPLLSKKSARENSS